MRFSLRQAKAKLQLCKNNKNEEKEYRIGRKKDVDLQVNRLVFNST